MLVFVSVGHFLFNIMSEGGRTKDIPGDLMPVLRASVEPRFPSVMQDIPAATTYKVIDEAQRALPGLHGKPPSHVCDAR